MICSKIIRTLLRNDSQDEEQIVTGISDYIPHCLRNHQNINISIIGSQQQIVNQILWNEFFSKSLIKESYYFLMQNYSTEGKQTMTAVFIKKDGKVYKMQDIMDWKSILREALSKENNDVTSLEIEAFSNKGNIKKMNIFISHYPINIDKLHLVLKTGIIQVAKLSKNQAISQIPIEEYRLLQESDRINKQSEQSVSQYAFTNKTKLSQISNLSIKTKQSHISKQNSKPQSKVKGSKLSSKKSNKKTVKDKYQQSSKKSMETNKDLTSKSFQQLKPNASLLKHERPSINRETILSKIITSKEQQILLLKEELQEKTDEYQVLIKQQQESHEKEVDELTSQVKEVLEAYSHSQKDAANQNVYLKQRVKILEETIEKTNDKLQIYNNEMESYVKNVRELQEINKKLTETNKQLNQEQEKNRNVYLSEYSRMNGEILSWKEKAEDYKVKYQKIVDMMKNVINFT